MSYLVLARKYRPTAFADVAGQEVVTRTLRGAISEARIGHAYLFFGPRGTGKTTSARLFAKALNCEKGPIEEPCGACDRCLSYDAGTEPDLIEIDAASNTGVDHVRSLRDQAGYVPLKARFKVFLIDEVHMLSKAAFNALLKTLEEPPPHVKFLFATTELHKVPDTVVSRCQVLRLSPLSEEQIVGRLDEVFGLEGVEAEPGVSAEIARRARGGMRDALSLADQLLALVGRTPKVADTARLAGEGSTEAIEAVLDRTGVAPDAIDSVVMGHVLTAGEGQSGARNAAVKGGVPLTVDATTVNKVCLSGMQAINYASMQIMTGQASTVIAGGMESMYNAPYITKGARAGLRMGHTQTYDHMFLDGLEDADTGKLMGVFAQEMADTKGLSREAMDQFAISSLQRAQEAQAKGCFKDEIVPFEVKTRKGVVTVAEDEQPKNANLDKIPTLRPAFKKDGGTITAANASSINDGASMMLLCSEKFMKENNLTPQARVVSQASFAQEPEWFTTAPVGAVKNSLRKADLKISDIDLFEINEAFSAVALACQKELEIDASKLNIKGGAVALGHPVGASGARILTTLIHSLESKKLGAVGICNGGGEATSVIIEKS